MVDTSFQRLLKRNPCHEGTGVEVVLQGKDKFKVETFYLITHRLNSELQKRK